MHRFFVSRSSFRDDELLLVGDQAHQISEVLRLRPGEFIQALDNSGKEFRVELTQVSHQAIHGRVLEQAETLGEPGTQLVLYQGMLKADKFEWVLQKGTEIGITEFVPMITERAMVGTLSRVKQTRWERIILEAAEQSGRGKIPMLQPLSRYEDALREARGRNGLALIPWEQEQAGSLRALIAGSQRGSPISLFIGPEGGFSSSEIEAAKALDVHPVSLGPRILRAETAGLVTAAVILFARGDLEAKGRYA